MFDLLAMLIDLLAALCPPLQAALLVFGLLLFGFCSYVFFDTANPAGGIVFALLCAVCLGLLVYGLVKGHFKRLERPGRPGRPGKRK